MTLKVGDRVRYTYKIQRTERGPSLNDKGTIREIRNSSYIVVEFDKYMGCLDYDRMLKPGHGWSTGKDRLELVNENVQMELFDGI